MNDDIDGEKLYKAIYNTFKRRGTLDLPKNLKARLNIIKERLLKLLKRMLVIYKIKDSDLHRL